MLQFLCAIPSFTVSGKEVPMTIHYSLLSEDNSRKVLQFNRFPFPTSPVPKTSYDCHVAFEITHFIEAEGIYTIEGKEYEIRNGDIFILRSNEKHRFLTTSKTGCLENLYVEPSFIWQGGNTFDLNILNRFNTSKAPFCHRLDRDNPACDTIRQIFTDIQQEFAQQDYGYAQMVRMHLNRILILLIRSFGYCNDEASTIHTPHMETIHRTMQYIEDHLADTLSMEFLSELANLSPNYYGTMFKQVCGMTPGEFITSKRIHLAISLLPDFEGTMLELALRCGFNNTANFNRAFRAYTGQVPSRYIPPVV